MSGTQQKKFGKESTTTEEQMYVRGLAKRKKVEYLLDIMMRSSFDCREAYNNAIRVCYDYDVQQDPDEQLGFNFDTDSDSDTEVQQSIDDDKEFAIETVDVPFVDKAEEKESERVISEHQHQPEYYYGNFPYSTITRNEFVAHMIAGLKKLEGETSVPHKEFGNVLKYWFTNDTRFEPIIRDEEGIIRDEILKPFLNNLLYET
jgi:hypothetical protein